MIDALKPKPPRSSWTVTSISAMPLTGPRPMEMSMAPLPLDEG